MNTIILNPASSNHDLHASMTMLKRNGAIVRVGVPSRIQSANAFSLLMPRRHLTGSLRGRIAQTQQLLDFRGVHEINRIGIQRIEEDRD